MKHIGLTGDPAAQHAVGTLLCAMATAQRLALAVHIGVRGALDANVIHAEGGEVWHCGPYQPQRDLLGLVDRVIAGSTHQEVAPHVGTSLHEMLNKLSLTGDPA